MRFVLDVSFRTREDRLLAGVGGGTSILTALAKSKLSTRQGEESCALVALAQVTRRPLIRRSFFSIYFFPAFGDVPGQVKQVGQAVNNSYPRSRKNSNTGVQELPMLLNTRGLDSKSFG